MCEYFSEYSTNDEISDSKEESRGEVEAFE